MIPTIPEVRREYHKPVNFIVPEVNCYNAEGRSINSAQAKVVPAVGRKVQRAEFKLEEALACHMKSKFTAGNDPCPHRGLRPL